MEILKKDEKGFSLIELLVVIAIIGVLGCGRFNKLSRIY